MLYVIIIITSIIIGLLRGGELEKLFTISIEGVLIFATALLLRLGVWAFDLIGISGILTYSPYIIIISYFLLIYVSIHNIKLPGFKYIILGLILNGFVITLNGGSMPVLVKQGAIININNTGLLESGTRVVHSLMNDNTLFAFLGDVISIPKPFPDTSIISVGDIMILVGLFILIQKIMMSGEELPKEDEAFL
ncbi:MAG: DUF5317 domain-containing protein [Atribacterota bacterium]|jgi:hypothetical protein|nr:DUF5317 domain-containing protein [Atribacterota bacterium]MDY0382643.1 DUF5317 domain-containing protein [Atribacterota bacterium]